MIGMKSSQHSCVFIQNVMDRWAGRAIGSIALACLVWGLYTPAAVAQVTYQYQGNPFTLFSCGPNSDNTATSDCSTPAPTNPHTSYTATDFVSATLTLSSALPANFPLQDVRTLPGFQLTMDDGQHTVTDADAAGMFAEVATDASGQIVQWRLVINTGGVNNGGIATINKGTSVFDQGVLACCDPTVPGNLALIFSAPGTWSSGSPSPAAAVTNLINLVANPLLGLTTGQIKSLTNKLDNALASIEAGRNKQARNQLNAFLNKVQAARKTGKMSAQTADTLTNAANAIIAML